MCVVVYLQCLLIDYCVIGTYEDKISVVMEFFLRGGRQQMDKQVDI